MRPRYGASVTAARDAPFGSLPAGMGVGGLERAFGAPVSLATPVRSWAALHGIERGPRWPSAHGVHERRPRFLARTFVFWAPTVRGDDGEDEPPAVNNEIGVCVRVALADRSGHPTEVPLDGPP